MKRQFFAVLCGVLFLVGCAASPRSEKVNVEGGSFINVTPSELSTMLKSKDFLCVNVHIPYEGEIEPTDAFIRYDETLKRISEYPADKAAKVLLYCRSDRMSTMAAHELAKAGYTNVLNLKGGMIAWEAAGYRLKVDPSRT